MFVKGDAMTRDEAVALCDKLEAYPFESQGGPLDLCVHWQQLRAFIASPRPEAPAWQAIETAPKDGTRILVGGGDCPRVHENAFQCNRFGCWLAGLGDAQQPTHWQPLPSPPTEADQ